MGVQINGSEGNVIATKGTFSGDVGIGGTLTYEDVTNIDSVGLVTARSGIEIGARPGVAASISVDGNMIVSGISTFADDVSFIGASANILFDKSANRFQFADNTKAVFGASGDLELYHDGSNSYVNNTGTGVLILQGNGSSDVSIRAVNGESGVVVKPNAAVELYYDNSKKIETTSSGATLTGALNVAGGSSAYPVISLTSNDYVAKFESSDSTARLIVEDSNSTDNYNGLQVVGNSTMLICNNEVGIQCVGDGATELYHDANKKFQTYANGNEFFGNLKNETDGTGNGIYLGEANDLQFYHATNSFVRNNNNAVNLILQSDYITFKGNSTNENYIKCVKDGAVELYYDNTMKVSTESHGLNIGQKAIDSDYGHTTSLGWSLSDGWTKTVFDGNVAANTPFTIFNKNASYNRYMWYIKFDGGVANYSSNNLNLCDERTKKDFADVSSQWDNIKNIGLKYFRYQDDSSSDPLKIGVVAQQVETVYPDIVDENWPTSNANPNTGEGEFYKGVKEEQLLMYSIKALQEAQSRIETLEAEVAALKSN